MTPSPAPRPGPDPRRAPPPRVVARSVARPAAVSARPAARVAPRPLPRPAGAARTRPPLLVRLLTSPLSAGAIERRARRTLGPWIRRLWWAPTLLGVALLALAGWGAWEARTPMLEPRHRAEAVCFALAQPPAFAPPMTVETAAALVRGRFVRGTPPAMAVQQAMGYRDEMVARQWRRRVGDYDISCAWLRLPEAGGASHWLVLGWMEDADLAMCSFRFGDGGPALTPEEQLWGNRLIARVLVPGNFRANEIPRVRLRAGKGDAMPTFGPRRPH